MKKVFLTINCQGGLGNQLFQFIFGYVLAKKNKINLRINIERYNSYNHQFDLDKFPEIYKLNIPKIKTYNFFTKIYLYLYHKFYKILMVPGIYKVINYFFLLDKHEFEKASFISNGDLLKKKIVKNISITGYFQSEKYFIHCKKIVLKLFRFPKITCKLCKKYLNLIYNKNSVAIHVRRGDYLNDPKVRYIHGILGDDYYKKSIIYIKKKVKNPFFFIFSDDIKLVKKTFSFFDDKKYIFIDTKSSINDLYLMSNCKHFIIANSSFSWWGAWLSKNKRKIVCAPKRWLRARISTPDIIPESWIKL
jgi:hypothetical protein